MPTWHLSKKNMGPTYQRVYASKQEMPWDPPHPSLSSLLSFSPSLSRWFPRHSTQSTSIVGQPTATVEPSHLPTLGFWPLPLRCPNLPTHHPFKLAYRSFQPRASVRPMSTPQPLRLLSQRERERRRGACDDDNEEDDLGKPEICCQHSQARSTRSRPTWCFSAPCLFTP